MTIPAWVEAWGPWIAAGSAALTVVLLLVSAVLLPRVLVALPADILVHPPANLPGRRVVRNLVGWTLIVLGVAMLVLPGQGVITVLAGLLLADVPGKHRLIVRLLRVEPVRRGVDALRARGGAPPLEVPDR